MHIGTARVALFNWLYARHTGGNFLLRIEDTDRERSTQEAVGVIFEGLKWLGLEADEPPVFQAARADRHREAVGELVARGQAYRDYMLPEELEAERERARAEGRVVRSPWRDADPATWPDRPYAVRLKSPLDGETIVADAVKGDVRFQNATLDDLILLRSDGNPTYNLAVVVDDHDMGITHVIRGDDHLNNAARQTIIYRALDWEVPVWAHLPMIHGPDGAKLSKRHGSQAVSEFDDMGYLPETMRNYLAKLVWGHGDDEIFTDEQAIGWFDIKDVRASPAGLGQAEPPEQPLHPAGRRAPSGAARARHPGEPRGAAAPGRRRADRTDDPVRSRRRQDHPGAGGQRHVRPEAAPAGAAGEGDRGADRRNARPPYPPAYGPRRGRRLGCADA